MCFIQEHRRTICIFVSPLRLIKEGSVRTDSSTLYSSIRVELEPANVETAFIFSKRNPGCLVILIRVFPNRRGLPQETRRCRFDIRARAVIVSVCSTIVNRISPTKRIRGANSDWMRSAEKKYCSFLSAVALSVWSCFDQDEQMTRVHRVTGCLNADLMM